MKWFADSGFNNEKSPKVTDRTEGGEEMSRRAGLEAGPWPGPLEAGGGETLRAACPCRAPCPKASWRREANVF